MKLSYRIQLILSLMFFLTYSCKTKISNDFKTEDKNQSGINMQFENGYWFDGKNFIKRTVWVTNGLLHFKSQNKSIDTIIEISGKFVIPPFAEAHNHNLESEYKLQERIDSYLNNGVFYVKHLSSIKKRIDPLMHYYNKPEGIDVSLAHAPLTATGGHPIELRKRFLEIGRFDDMFNSIEDIESHGYFIIDNVEELNSKWKNIMSFSPDFIKINLLNSEEYEKRKNDTTYFGEKGLDPKIIPAIVAKSHESGLRVSAHVNTAYDFHVALVANVDEIAHIPERHNGKPIKVEDALLAKKMGVIVVTTASLVMKNKEKQNYKSLVENVKSNLKLLKDSGVQLAIGSDTYNDNSVEEFEFLLGLGIFTKLELLKMWCENSAITTFPERKIGYLKEGYEASFLVLNKNPLIDIKKINESITMKVKQGFVLKQN